MNIDTKKLKEIIEELYDNLGGRCLSSEVCIFETEDGSGRPIQFILKATVDEDELIEETEDKYICVSK